ncbi:hypothetical protein N826_04500 [Skermanella aerolata KACC 11604]|nr:hypothetical protein N826_04500 [Skermanella aerolata KACC 11604]
MEKMESCVDTAMGAVAKLILTALKQTGLG